MSTRYVRSRFLPLLALVATFTAAGNLQAQNARVVTASTTQGTLLELDFVSSTSQVLNTDPGARTRIQSVVFRDDGAAGVHCIAADDLAGQVLFYQDAAGDGQIILDAGTPGHPAFPTGLSLDSARNLYGLTVDGTQSGVWVLRRDKACAGTACLTGGYTGPVGAIDRNIGGGSSPVVDRLADTLVVNASGGNLAAGDLLVLSNNPATVLRYSASDLQAFLATLAMGGTPPELDPDVFIHPPDAVVPADQRFPLGARPSGLVLAPGGNLLISSGEGVVYSFLPDGTRLTSGGVFVDFVSGLGAGRYQIGAGNQDGEARVFLTDRAGGRVLRYTIESDGTGTLDATVSNLTDPFAVSTTTSSIVPTPAGSEIPVSTSNLMTSLISNVVTTGSTSITEFIFVDPREAEISTPVGQPLHRSLFLDEISALLPVGIEIPAYVRSLRKDDPVSGPPTFILLVVDTSYEVLGPVFHQSDESLVLGYDPNCDDPDPTLRPRLFWVPNLDEPASPEGPRFINLSNACGVPASLAKSGTENRNVKSKGVTRRFSLFLVGARDTRLWHVTAQAQLDGLGMVLAASNCIASPVLSAIQSEYAAAQASFAAVRLRDAVDELRNIVSLIQGNPAALAGCTDNEGGGLVARALATIFTLDSSLRDPD